MIRRLLRWLAHGSEDLYLPTSWLEHRDRMRAHEGYTRRQLEQGSVAKDTAATRREAFWLAQAAKRPSARVHPFGRRSA